MGRLPFSIYFHFETTSAKRIYNFHEDATLYLVWYAFVVAFHLSLNTDRTSVMRSFNYTLDQLNNVGHLLNEMLSYFDSVTAGQLRDCVKAVFEKRHKFSLSEMFSCELKFVIDLLKRWLVDKDFRRYRELDFFSKQKFETESPIDWNKK